MVITMETIREEDVLRDLWIKVIENSEKVEQNSLDKSILNELIQKGYCYIKDGEVVLTEKGIAKARGIVRLHRLTERLLFDVLRAEEEIYETVACRVEHYIPPELEESICTLLGHPRRCPHGKPIPPGKCCREKRKSVSPIIRPLTELGKRETGRVSYIDINDNSELQITSYGIEPGVLLTVIETKPSIIVEVKGSKIAIDRNSASKIFVVKR